jgi:TPP-dependent pyruvate/acetoin dehydrogenase alpha subunit
MGDPSTEYRTREEVQKARENDPIQRYESWLLSERIMTQREVDAVKSDLERELDEAVKFAQESPEPSLEESLADIFTPSLAVKES